MCLAKIQISLCICTVWSESSLGTFRIAKDAKFLYAENKDSDQTVHMLQQDKGKNHSSPNTD